MINNVDNDGDVTFSSSELPPGGQSTFNVTIRPKLSGIYESTRARVKYNSGLPVFDDITEDMRSGLSSSLGRTRIISISDHQRNTSYYFKEWVIFMVAFGISIFYPFNSWLILRKQVIVKQIQSIKRK